MDTTALKERLRLVAITHRALCQGSMEETIEHLAAGGATALMLREKDLSPRELYDLAAPLRRITLQHGLLFLVNNSIEVALAVGAEGAHLGELSLPPARARAIAGTPFILGFSAHTELEVNRAAEAGMDYCTISPIFQPNSKEMSAPTLGIEGLRRVAQRTTMPLVALGGIEPHTARDCIEAGAVGVAAIGSLFASQDPTNAARRFAEALV